MKANQANQAVQIRALQRDMRRVYSELNELKHIVEDSLLTADEARFLDDVFAKLRRGDSSDFVRVEHFPE